MLGAWFSPSRAIEGDSLSDGDSLVGAVLGGK